MAEKKPTPVKIAAAKPLEKTAPQGNGSGGITSLNKKEVKSKEQEKLMKMPAEELARAIHKLLLEDMVSGE